MDAHKAIITNIFNNSTLIEVPFFQRSYVWKEDLWARLIEDMEYVVKTNKPHFLGSIILKEGRKPKPGENFADCRTVVDGQQRLTTFLLFMKVLCLKLGQSTLFDFQFRIMGQSIALRHGKNDIDAFESVIASKTAVRINNPESQSRIIEAYNYFIDHIDENNNPNTAPSKRILAIYPTYTKPLDGYNIAKDIGIDLMRQECQHFNAWVERLTQL